MIGRLSGEDKKLKVKRFYPDTGISKTGLDYQLLRFSEFKYVTLKL